MDNQALTAKLRTGSPPAPGDLVLLEGFLNTWSGEMNIDDFETAGSTEAWLRSVSLWTGARKLTREQHKKLVGFRSDLRAWILDNERVQPLNELIAEVSFNAQFTGEGDVRLQSAGTAFQQVMGRLIDAILEGQQAGTWDRLKCCELESCGWAFYDGTRSRTRRWCSMKTCGSRHKAREYYKRNR